MLQQYLTSLVDSYTELVIAEITVCERKVGLLMIDKFRERFNPPRKTTQEIGVALLFCTIYRTNNGHLEAGGLFLRLQG